MCDLNPFNNDDNAAEQEAIRQQQAAAAEAAQIAARAAKNARDEAAQVAAAGATGTEKAKRAAEKKLRAMQSAGDPFAFGAAPQQQASIGYRLAMGA